MPVYPQDLWQARHPVGVGAEINNVCNAKCTFCGYGKGDDGKAADPRKKTKLDDGVFRHTLKLFSDAGGGVFTLSPILGEVSAHPAWLDMVRTARSYPGVTGVTCFTNAILLHRFGAEAILTSGLTVMSISTCLGSREAYKRLYGVDKYDQVVANIFDILETNRRLGAPVDVTLRLRIDKPFDTFYASELYGRLTALLDPSQIEILDNDWDDFRGIVKGSDLPAGHGFKQTYVDKKTPCYAMFRKLEVLADGTIQACACRVEPELWTGSILEHRTLESAWHNPGLERLRTNWFNGNLPKCCTTCSHYIPYTSLLAPARPGNVARRVARKLLRLATRGRARAAV